MLGTILASCGGGSDDPPPASSDQPQTDPDEPAEEDTSACVGVKKGEEVKVAMGGKEIEDKYNFMPDKLKLKAGRFVTIKLTNPSVASHSFAIDSIDCNSGLVPPGDTLTLSFKVPKGTTPFYCAPHKVIPMNGEIAGK